jgi:hypothetical protein
MIYAAKTIGKVFSLMREPITNGTRAIHAKKETSNGG